MKNLEQLCRPLLQTVCEYYCAAKAGAPVDTKELQEKIRLQLQDIQMKSEENQILKRDFARIEKALVFFIDYTIKEGHFPFSESWREIARSYNELSGDEKFFDVLSETLDDPEASERIKFLHLLLGLGFDGTYSQTPEYLERKMRVCATRFTQAPPITTADLYAPDAIASHRSPQHTTPFKFLLLLTILCLVFSFSYNYSKFDAITSPFNDALDTAYKKACESVALKKTAKPPETRPATITPAVSKPTSTQDTSK